MFVGDVKPGSDDGKAGGVLMLAGFEFFDPQLGPDQSCCETIADVSEGYQQCDK